MDHPAPALLRSSHPERGPASAVLKVLELVPALLDMHARPREHALSEELVPSPHPQLPAHSFRACPERAQEHSPGLGSLSDRHPGYSRQMAPDPVGVAEAYHGHMKTSSPLYRSMASPRPFQGRNSARHVYPGCRSLRLPNPGLDSLSLSGCNLQVSSACGEFGIKTALQQPADDNSHGHSPALHNLASRTGPWTFGGAFLNPTIVASRPASWSATWVRSRRQARILPNATTRSGKATLLGSLVRCPEEATPSTIYKRRPKHDHFSPARD